jgi:hypothetical protein
MDDVAVGIAEHLHFNVARAFDPFFEQHHVVAEARRCLALAAVERVLEIARAVDLPHPLAAAARDRLDQHRIADRVGFRLEPRRRLILAEIARRHRNAGLGHQCLRRVLQPHRTDRIRLGPDPHQPGIDHRLGEVGILAQKAVARMDRLGASRLGRRDDLLADQIAFARRARPDVHRFVRHPHVQRLGVGVRIDRDGAHPEPLRGAHNPTRDLPAVGDEQGLDHCALAAFPKPPI